MERGRGEANMNGRLRPTIPSPQHLPHTNTIFYAGILPIIRDLLITLTLVKGNRLRLLDACFEDAFAETQLRCPLLQFFQDFNREPFAPEFGSDKHPLDFHLGGGALLQRATCHCLPLEESDHDMLNMIAFVELGIKCMFGAVAVGQFGVEQGNQQTVVRMLGIGAEQGDHGILDFECQR